MAHLKIILVIITLLVFVGRLNASIVDITVATDKPVYQLGEYVTISITAYNPNPQPVTLTGGFYFASYIIDGVYDWAEGRSAPQVMEYETINPDESHTWILTHSFWEMQDYPLELGTHTIVGEVLAIELFGNNQSPPLEIEVVPEPGTLLLLAFGLINLKIRRFTGK